MGVLSYLPRKKNSFFILFSYSSIISFLIGLVPKFSSIIFLGSQTKKNSIKIHENQTPISHKRNLKKKKQ